tara:strand:- start:18024 stop:20048 length:2025 start_codon:yes stop_codon:yes gene_type:complete
MAKTKISEYDATAANNTDIDSINIAEGMAPSNVNNAIREMMAHLKDMDAGTQALTSPQLTSADINGGTVDGVTIGGASAGAITGTTITASTSLVGTLGTAAQANVTSLGTLTGLTVSGTTSLAGASTSADITFGDNDKAIFGAGSDLTIEHNGTNSTITSTTGTLTIQNTADDEDVDIVSDDGSGGTAVYFRADGSSGQTKLYHNNAGTGTLRLNTSSDGIDIIGHADIEGHFTATDGCTITTADNSTQLTLISTDADASEGPRLDLTRASASPADGDLIGTIRYLSDDDGGTATVFGEIQVEADDVTDGTEDAEMRLMIRNNGNLRNAVEIGATEVVFNENSDDVNFRVESDTVTHALFVQGSDGSVGLGTSSPSRQIHLASSVPALRLEDTDVSGLYGEIVQLSAGDLSFRADHGDVQESSSMSFSVDGSEAMRLTSSGLLGVNTTSPKGMVHVTNTGTRPNFLSSGAGDADLDFAVDSDEVMQLGRFNKTTEAVDAIVMSLELDGDVTIEDGNLVVANGHGIDFSATSGTGESEILDDYEEGTFTPTLEASSGSNPTVGGSASGRYTKIGDMVTVYMSVTNITGGDSASGNLEIHSLPFAPTTKDSVGTVLLDNFTFVSGTTYCVSYCDVSDDLIKIMQIRDTTTDAAIDNDNIDDGAADFIITMQYRTTS